MATILREVLRAVVYLHEHSVVHKSVAKKISLYMNLRTIESFPSLLSCSHIRAEHILIDSDGDVKLCGHGDITWMVSEGVKRTTVCDFKGLPEWMAPEIVGQVRIPLPVFFFFFFFEVFFDFSIYFGKYLLFFSGRILGMTQKLISTVLE